MFAHQDKRGATNYLSNRPKFWLRDASIIALAKQPTSAACWSPTRALTVYCSNPATPRVLNRKPDKPRRNPDVRDPGGSIRNASLLAMRRGLGCVCLPGPMCQPVLQNLYHLALCCRGRVSTGVKNNQRFTLRSCSAMLRLLKLFCSNNEKLASTSSSSTTAATTTTTTTTTTTAATAIASVTATTNNNNNTAATTTTTTVAAVVTVALIPTIITFKHNIRGSSGSSSNRCSSSSFSSKGGGNSIHTFVDHGNEAAR